MAGIVLRTTLPDNNTVYDSLVDSNGDSIIASDGDLITTASYLGVMMHCNISDKLTIKTEYKGGITWQTNEL